MAIHQTPIERKPLYHVLPGRSVLTLGGLGCPLRCRYCLNAPLSQRGAGYDRHHVDAHALVARAQAVGAAIGWSYNEPGLALEDLLAVAEHAVPNGVPLVWKTSGFLSRAALDASLPLLLAVNIDLKAADPTIHRDLTGAPLGPVIAALERAVELGVWLEVSTVVVPGLHDPEALRAVARRVAALGAPWHLARFYPAHRMTDRPPTSSALLTAAVEIGREEGVHHVYVERGLGDGARRTDCPHCGRLLVERAPGGPGRSHLASGRCPDCGRGLPGRW